MHYGGWGAPGGQENEFLSITATEPIFRTAIPIGGPLGRPIARDASIGARDQLPSVVPVKTAGDYEGAVEAVPDPAALTQMG